MLTSLIRALPALTLLLGLATGAEAETPRPGGTLTAIVQPEPTAMTSAINNTYANGVVSSNIFDGLVSYDQDFNPQPSLATSWETSADGLSMTFHLRHGVKWHDGQPFTSADVKYSLEEVWKKLHARGRVTFAAVREVQTPDAYTAVLKLDHPSPVILSAVNAVESQVLPRHLYAGTDVASNPYNVKPVGTGPFRFKQWERGQYIALEKNPDYWEAGKPLVDKLVFRIIPDAASRAAALETGEVQYAPYNPIPLADVQRIKALPDLVVDTHGYEWQAPYYFIEFNLRRPALAKLQVRQAIAQAIDRQGLIDTVWYGFGKVADSPIVSSVARFHAPGLPQYPYDPAKAEQLLDAAGYPRQANGVRFSITLDHQPFNDTFANTDEYIRQNLKRVGIEATVRNQDLPSFLRKVYGEYDFDINGGQFSGYSDPQMGVLRQYTSSTIKAGIPWVNASNYRNPEMDALIEQIQQQGEGPQRVASFQRFQRIAQTDLPVLPLFEMRNFSVYSKRLGGVSQAPDGALSSLKNVWLKP
ncbi:ABC transporter substrate-binding protein [Pseudomonas sp. NPDC007930]|uniref:ABC transporter substrate-binding protein n=1 Tax=Pseudomonas sp. NPDC007930 TaxID=3364417 RepID=UPI0036EAB84B